MANRLPSRGDFDIPGGLIDDHEWMADELIDGPTGQECQLTYPATNNTVCPNCKFDPRTKRSSGIYKPGGPIPFENHTQCPWCNGEGRSSRPVTSDIRLRIYWRPQDWTGFTNRSFENPEGMAMVIGYMTDLPDLEKAATVTLNRDIKGIHHWKTEREGEAIPHGLRQNRYFIQFLKRVGGG